MHYLQTREPYWADQPNPFPRLTRGQKILIGAGVVAAGVVIAVLVWPKPAKAEALPVAPPAPGPTPGPSPTPVAPKPPNISGDPQGYNTQMFPDSQAVRSIFEQMRYVDDLPPESPPSKQTVRNFQQHWNALTNAVAAGKLSQYKGLNQFDNLRGTLSVDGIPGPNTLRALEIAYLFQSSNPQTVGWFPEFATQKAG